MPLYNPISNSDLIEQGETNKYFTPEKEAALQAQILAIDGSPKGVFATAAALAADATANTEDGKKYNYLVTADGKWYYWNGTEWAAGAVYQAIADASIVPSKTSFLTRESTNLILFPDTDSVITSGVTRQFLDETLNINGTRSTGSINVVYTFATPLNILAYETYAFCVSCIDGDGSDLLINVYLQFNGENNTSLVPALNCVTTKYYVFTPSENTTATGILIYVASTTAFTATNAKLNAWVVKNDYPLEFEKYYKYSQNTSVINEVKPEDFAVHTNSFPRVLMTLTMEASDMCQVGSEIWTAGEGTMKRYTVSLDDKTATPTHSFTHEFGHCNTIDYCPGCDAMIIGNGSQDVTPSQDKKLYIIPNIAAVKLLDTGSALSLANHAVTVDFTSDTDFANEIKVQAVWGESNLGLYNICYVITNNNTKLRRILLGKGTNNLGSGMLIEGQETGEYNGTYLILDKYDIVAPDRRPHQNNGTTYYNGSIYAVGEHNVGLLMLKMTPMVDGSVATDLYREKLYNADATTKSTIIVEGVCFYDGHLILGTGSTSYVFE